MLRLAVCGLALIGVLAALGWRATPAHADGGAPVVAYVLGAGNGGRDLAVIEIAARKVVALVSFDRASAAIALRGDSQVLYVAVPNDYRVLDDYRVLALDATTLSVQGTLPTGRGPDALAVGSAVTGNLFVANGGSGTVTVLDVGTARVLATISVGAHPAGIAVAGPTSGIREACDAEVYVANSGANSVTVLSAVRRQVLATIPVPGGPCAIVVPATGGVANVGTRAGTVVALDLAAHAVLGPLLVVRGGATGQMDYDAIARWITTPLPVRSIFPTRLEEPSRCRGLCPRQRPRRRLRYRPSQRSLIQSWVGQTRWQSHRTARLALSPRASVDAW